MNPTAFANAAALVTLLIFVALASAEALWPARRQASTRPWRLSTNFGLAIANLVVASVLPVSAAAAAAAANRLEFGLFRHWPALPAGPMLVVLVGVNSLASYGCHVSFHKVRWLWPLHAVHHRDDAIDISTTLRTHPLAALLLALVVDGATMVLGPPPALAALAGTVLLVAELAAHANLRVPPWISARLEPVLVTPRLHLIHHARARELHDSNYGSLFSIWDHLFGTYRAPDAQPPLIGLEDSG